MERDSLTEYIVVASAGIQTNGSICNFVTIGALALLTTAAVAQSATSGWLLREIAAADADIVRFGNKPSDGQIETARARVLYAVAQSIAAVAELEAELVVVDGEYPNAFAGEDARGTPIVGINFAMLDLLNDDVHAAAALFGHEFAHLKLSHGEQQKASDFSSGVLGVLGGALLGAMGVPAGQTLSSLTVAAVQSDYSRDQEREADYLGAIWALEAGYDPYGAVHLHQALGRTPGAGGSTFLSSHPSGPERIANLTNLARRLTGR